MKAAEQRKLKTRFAKMLRSHGVEPQTEECDTVGILETKAGKLYLRHDGDDTIFARFDEPQRAAQFVKTHAQGGHLNGYSGKWNFHFFGEWDASSAMTQLESELLPLLTN